VKDYGQSLTKEQIKSVQASVAGRQRRKKAQERIRYGVMAAISALSVVTGFQWSQAERQRWTAERNSERVELNGAR
jgi:hypothetical protein